MEDKKHAFDRGSQNHNSSMKNLRGSVTRDRQEREPERVVRDREEKRRDSPDRGNQEREEWRKDASGGRDFPVSKIRLEGEEKKWLPSAQRGREANSDRKRREVPGSREAEERDRKRAAKELATNHSLDYRVVQRKYSPGWEQRVLQRQETRGIGEERDSLEWKHSGQDDKTLHGPRSAASSEWEEEWKRKDPPTGGSGWETSQANPPASASGWDENPANPSINGWSQDVKSQEPHASAWNSAAVSIFPGSREAEERDRKGTAKELPANHSLDYRATQRMNSPGWEQRVLQRQENPGIGEEHDSVEWKPSGKDDKALHGPGSAASSRWEDEWKRKDPPASASGWCESPANPSSNGWRQDVKSQEPHASAWNSPTASIFGARRYRKQSMENWDHQQRQKPQNTPKSLPRLKSGHREEIELHSDVDTDSSDIDEEDEIILEEKTYQEVLPRLQALVQKSASLGDWPNDKEEKMCMVCPTQQFFKGWKALLQHAEKYKKKRAYHHRGYFRALTEILQPVSQNAGDTGSQERAVLIEGSNIATDEIIVWPPVVIVENIDAVNLPNYVPDLPALHVEKTVQVRGSSSKGGANLLVVFPASEVGHIGARLLSNILAKLNSQYSWRNKSYEGSRKTNRWTKEVSGLSVQGIEMLAMQQSPRGYLAEPNHMQNIDPTKIFVNWSCVNKRETLKRSTKQAKQEYEQGRAQLTAKIVEVDQLAESHQLFMSSKEVLAHKLKDTERSLEMQKLREQEIKLEHAEQLSKMTLRFKENLNQMEREGFRREEKLHRQIEANQNQLEKEQISRLKEVEILEREFRAIAQELEKEKAQKALEKETEIARKREALMMEFKKKEAQFNEEARLGEHNLMDNHEKERMRLLNEFEKKKEDLLLEWLNKQTVLKATAEKAKQEKESLKESSAPNIDTDSNECAVCLTDFDAENPRALIQPCNHAKVCLNCARLLHKKKSPCPICRQKMKSKPKALPFKLFF